MSTQNADIRRLELLVGSVHITLQDATRLPDDTRRKLLRCAWVDLGRARDVIARCRLDGLDRMQTRLTQASVALTDAIKTAKPLLRAELLTRAHEHVLAAMSDCNHLAKRQTTAEECA
ncbi:hypothetical protein JCM15519_38430 [Fundidesulfovibrio butyratiphilus]